MKFLEDCPHEHHVQKASLKKWVAVMEKIIYMILLDGRTPIVPLNDHGKNTGEINTMLRKNNKIKKSINYYCYSCGIIITYWVVSNVPTAFQITWTHVCSWWTSMIGLIPNL